MCSPSASGASALRRARRLVRFSWGPASLSRAGKTATRAKYSSEKELPAFTEHPSSASVLQIFSKIVIPIHHFVDRETEVQKG